MRVCGRSLAPARGGRRQVQHRIGEPGEAAERRRVVEVADAAGTMPAARSASTRAGARRQCERRASGRASRRGDAQADVAAADDQQHRSLEARRSVAARRGCGRGRPRAPPSAGSARQRAESGPSLGDAPAPSSAQSPCRSPSPSSRAARPSASTRDEPILARRHPPGHRPALRLPRRRLRLVQVPHARRPRDPRRAPAEGAQRTRRRAPGSSSTCQAAPQTDIVLEARTVPGRRRVRDPQDADAASSRSTRPRPTSPSSRCSCRPTKCSCTVPASTSNPSCSRTASAAATKSYRSESAPSFSGPLELHIRHLPGGLFTDHVFGCHGRRWTSYASKARSAPSSCAKNPASRSCCWPRASASRRSRPWSST